MRFYYQLNFIIYFVSLKIETEKIKLKNRKKIRIRDINADNLLTMDEDVIIDIVR